MAIKSISEELYKRLEPVRDLKIDEFIDEALLIEPSNTISEVIGLLKKNNEYQAFMKYKEDKVVSINVRDILEYKNITTAKPSVVGKVIPALSYKDKISKAAGLMTHYRVRALAVIDNGEIVGKIDSKRIIGLLNRVELDLKASSLMSSNLITITEEEKGATARNLMIKNKIDHLPVVKDGKAVGILTSWHLLELLVPPERPDMMRVKSKRNLTNLPLTIKGWADKSIVSVEVHESIRSVVNTMLDNNSSYTLVNLDEELQGIITTRDLVSLAQEMVKEEVPAYIVGLPDDPVEAELAKSKFLNTLRLLKKVISILEARCRIKIKDVTGERKRYEVDMHIITPTKRFTYTDEGYDLANVFDNVSNYLKRSIERSTRKSRESPRYEL